MNFQWHSSLTTVFSSVQCKCKQWIQGGHKLGGLCLLQESPKYLKLRRKIYPTLMDMSLSRLWELVMDREALGCCTPWGHEGLNMTE